MMSRWWALLLARLLGAGRVRRRRFNPALAAYRWRYEIALSGLSVGVAQLGATTHWAASLVIILVVAVALIWWPALRRWLRGRVWAVLVQHRLRSAFRGAALSTWAGRMPAILWTSPRPAGVRVLVSLPAGLESGDLRALRDVLAAACFASDVLVERHPRHANLVALYIVTRVPAE